MKLYEIAEAMRDESAYVNMETGEIDMDKLSALQVQMDEKLDSICTIISEAQSDENAIAAEIARLQERKRVIHAKAERLKEYVAQNVESKWSNARYRVGIRTTESVVADMDMLPAEYIRQTVKLEPDKDAIKTALREGQVIPGARLEEHRHANIR